MSDDSVQVTYADNFEPLVDLLTGVEHPGDYFVSGSSETPLPTLKVSGVGTVAFPVPPSQARELIEASAEKAPYGRGDQTLVDETVRKVWQISPDKISIHGSGWANTFKDIIEKVAEGLGCEAKSVEAEFYKLLIYEKAGFFVAHRDSEKAGGMFGTLVISLPSEHTGGELIVRHAGREVTVDLSVSEPGEVRFAAFYADCEHEVRPITSGYRVCLIYNLVARNAKTATPVAPPDARKAVPQAAELLARWANSDAAPRKIVYLLDHHYTQAAVSFSSLKGRDANVGRVLKEAAKEAGCHCYTGIVHIEESGSAEYYGDYYSRGRRRRWGDDEEEESEDEFEIGEVCDAAYYIDQWKDIDGTEMEFGSIPLDENELLPPGALDDEEPDEKHFSEATGNAGASFERTYLRAAVILWPANRTDEVLVSAGTDSAIARLGQLVTETHHGAAAKRAAAGESVRRVAGMVLENWGDSYFAEGKRLNSLLKALIRFKDADLLFETAGPLIAKHYTGSQNYGLIQAVMLLGFERGKHLLEELIETRGTEYPGAFMDLWIGLAASKDTGPLAQALFGLIVRKLAESPSRARHHASTDEESEGRPVKLTPALLIQFLKAVGNAGKKSDVESLLQAMLSSPGVYTVKNHLLPALEVAEGEEQHTDEQVLERIWSHCVSYFLGRSEYPPQKPKDWAQAVTIPDRTPQMRELERFARDPELREHRFRVAEEVRRRIEATIQQLSLDMSCTTERQGRPYTLVCVKNHASFERACARYREDIAQMRRLSALKAAASPDQAALLSRLNSAISARGA